MKIKEFHVKNVKSFKEELSIKPSKFNLFIGENSSGKSNLMNLMKIAIQSANGTTVNIPPFDGRATEQSYFSCLMEFDKRDVDEMSSGEAFAQLVSESKTLQIPGIELLRNETESFSKQPTLEFWSSWSREGNMAIRQSFPAFRNLFMPDRTNPIDFYTQSRISFVSKIFNITHQQILRNSIFVSDTRDLQVNFKLSGWNQNEPINADSILTFVTRWKLNDRPTYNNFITLVKSLLPRLADLYVEPSGSDRADLFIKESGLRNLFSGSEFSKGSREILVVLGALALARESSILFIEEPEIHLHPSAVKELKSIMLDAVKNRNVQIVISTHYPLFLQGLYPESDGDIKVFKFENKNQSGNFVSEIRTDKEISELIEQLEFKENGEKDS
ncbi:MAG: AAA family ATPase [Conexivisphaerales archaeon]